MADRDDERLVTLVAALRAITKDARATYDAIASGKGEAPIISIGQWGRLRAAEAFLGTLDAALDKEPDGGAPDPGTGGSA